MVLVLDKLIWITFITISFKGGGGGENNVNLVLCWTFKI